MAKARTNRTRPRARPRVRGRDWTAKFIAALRETGVVSLACSLAVVGRTTAYARRKDDPAFAKRWDDALEAAVDELEAEARRRAVVGWDEPVYGPGAGGRGTVRVGTIRRYSESLLKFLLAGRRPEVFGTRTVHAGAPSRGGSPVELCITAAGEPPSPKGGDGEACSA